ncbi:MAG TPA: protein translocase subunit SecD [Verrucomicrobiae bacterium]|nr:protein translocase subunit SecD [Verrucomicrobiae bacterium]
MTTETIIFFGGLMALVLFVWHLAATEDRSRRKVGAALWVIAICTCIIATYPLHKTIRLGLDLKGGSSFLMELNGEVRPAALQQAVEVVRKRVDNLGVAEPIIQPVGERRIMVQMPGLSEENIQTTRNQLSRVAQLEFRLVHPENAAELAKVDAGGPVPIGYELMKTSQKDKDGQKQESRYLVKRRPEMSGKHVRRAYHAQGAIGESFVSLEFKPEGKELFGRITEQNVGRQLAIVLDGELKSAPRINEAIYGGRAQITGDFTPQEATELSSVLENPLDTPVRIVEERTVAGTLGHDSIRSGVIASAIGFAAVIVFMVWYYHFSGVVAVLTLAANFIVLFGLMAQFRFTLTLPGIAGVILTAGMAVDANVLIYERVREEIAAGKALGPSIIGGFDKAFSAIIDSNLTTIITAIIMFYLGSGPVRGFAVTLTLGIVGTLFGALIVGRNLFEWALAKNVMRTFSARQFIIDPKFDLLRYRWYAIAFSIAVLVAGAIAFKTRGEACFGVDFAGGEAVTLTASAPTDIAVVRKTLADAGLDSAMIQAQRSAGAQGESYLVRTKFGDGQKAADAITRALPKAGFTLSSIDSVGPVVGKELLTKSAIALFLALFGILIYVTARFEMSFAVGGIVALIHDVAIVLVAFPLTGQEISLTVVGSALGIAGFSINDTIVIFDRVRECLRNSEKGTLYELMNRALNETLSRTVLTNLTVFITILSLLFFGGPMLRDFSFAWLVGSIAGSYSTLYIASPIVLWWTGGSDEWLRRQVVESEEEKPAVA